MILQIKRGNRVIAESADFSYSPSLQEVRKLTCEVVSVVPIEFKAYNSKSESEYDTVVYNGNTFILYQAPSGDNLNEAGKYKYSLLFYGKEVLLQNVAFLDIVSGTGGEINKIRYTHGGLFQFWGDAKQLAARIEANIESYNASLGAGYTGIGTWTLNVDAEGELTEDMIDITDGTNLFEALKNFYDKFYLNYYFSTTANGGIITITDKTRPSVNWTFKQGDGGGAVKVSSSVDTSTPVITRIIPQGGSRNVPPEYKKDAKPADESRYCPYILLPNDSDGNIRYYIDSEYGLKNYGVRGKTISNTFSGIYPSIRGKKLGDLYPSGLPEWDTYKSDGEPDPQSGKVAGEGASASTRIDKIIGSTPIKSDDSDSFFIYMTSPGFNLGYKVYEDGDSSGKINDNVQPQYKPHAMFDKYRDFESFDIYGTRAYYDQPVKVTATFSGKMLFSILPIGSDAVGKKVKINLRMVLNRVLGQASPLKEVVIGEEGATGMLEIPYDKTSLVGYIEKGQNTTVTIRVEFTFDSDVPAGSCKIGFSEEMTCNIHFGNQDGSQDRFYYKYASVTDAVFSMRTGTYTGTEFKINKNGIIPLYGEVNGDTGETEEDVAMFNKGARYKISCYRTDSDNAKLPLYTDGKSPSIAAGTEFVILNIVMPESYVTMAENTLEKAALDYLSRYDHENRTVSLDISSGFVAEHPNLFIDFIEGNMLKVRDDGIGVFDFSDNGQIVDMQLQIQSLEIKYSKENMFPSYSCTIARRKILSFYERLAQENQTASTQNTTNVTLGGSGTGSGTNIFSEQLLNDLIASFQKFNGWFEWDEVNQALRCKSAFYTNQWISALGAQSGSGEPGGGEGGLIKAVYGFADLGKTFDDSNLSNTFNAYTINEIWKLAKEGGGIKNITQSGSGNAVTNMALSSDGKTITAVFGETFARQQDFGTLNNTVTQLSNKLNNFLEGSDADNIINKWKELEAFLDGLTESDNLAELLALKADKTITISAGTGLTGGGNLSANRTLSLATTGVKAGTYTKVTVDTYGRVTVGNNPTTLAGYGITDAVTLTTNQTISGQKTFTKNILMNSGIGLSYGGNIVFRNTAGNTVISSYGSEGMIYFRPNGDTSDDGVIQINKQGHLNGVSAGFTGGVSAARLTANEYIQIGDAQLVYDSVNKALRVKHRTDGNTVGFYSDGWVSALGVKTGGSGGGSGVVNTVYSFANLTDGTTFSDSDLDNTFNAYTIKKLYDMAGQGGLDADAMWAELKKADSSKVIDASHIPTSVLDGRWVKKAGDTMTGTLTSASTSGAIVFKGVENCDITNIYKNNGVIKNDDGGLTSIRNGLRFNWYDTYWYIGNLRGSSTESAGFGVVDHNNKLVLRVTPNDVRAPRFMSTVATGLSPLIVSSNTTVDNLSADLLDGYHAFGTSNALIKYGYTVSGTEPAWCRIATYSIRNTETMTDVCFVLHSAFNDLFGLLVVKTRGTAVVEGLLIASYNINRLNIRIYHDAEKKNIELYCYGGSNYSIIQANLLYSHDRNGGANTNITLYRKDTKAPSWSTYVNPVFAPLQNSSEVAKKLQTPRTLWGQSFDGTANVSGNMTGVGSITMSGNLEIGNGTSPNAILFYGTTGDSPGGYNHTFIAERLWGGTESSELVLFKGNDLGNDNEAVNVSNSGPDRIRHIAAAHLFQTYTSPLAGSVEDVCTSSALKSLFGIAANRVTSYVPFMSTVASGTAPFIVVSNTVVGNLNADLLDGFHAERFLLSVGRSDGTFDLNTYSERAIKEIRTTEQTTNNAPFAGYGLLANLWDSNKFAALQIGGTSTDLFFRGKHDGTNKITSAWHRLLHTENYASIADGRYVKKSGDTMTGDLAMDTNKGFYIPHRTRVVKTSGNWIHGGADVASSTDANLRFASWYGIGWYPTIDSTSGVRQGDNAMWLNVRTGALNVAGGIKESTICIGRVNSAGNYDAAYNGEINRYDHHLYLQHHSGKYLIMCTGGGLAGIGTNSPGEKLHVAGNTRTDGYFKSTVGTGTQPYQCSSTTLNSNLNADMLDNWHLNFFPRNYNNNRTYATQFALGGTDNSWKKIFACSESGAGPYQSVTVWGRIWYAYGNHAQEEVRYYHFCAIFYMRSGPSSSDSSVGNVENSARLYLPTFAKGMDNIRLVRVGTNNFEIQVRQIYSWNNGYIQYQYSSFGCNVSAWASLQPTSNTSVAVSAEGASTLADSRASSADVWTYARTFYIQDHNASHTGAGVSVNGSANVYLKLPNSIQCSDWFRSTGNSGWYHQDYGGGIYMQDSNFIRNYGSKRLRIQTDTYDTLQLVRSSGSGGSSIAFYNGGGTFRGQLGVNASSWFSFDTGTATANQNVVEISPAGGIHSKAEITAKASGSDIRLKKDIQNYNAMNIINKFRSVKYHWNDIAKANSEVYNNDYDQFGLIAQDLIAGGFEQWVRDVFHDYYTVTYERLIPVVWKGLQEVDDEVTRLKKRVRELEKRLGSELLTL
nr:MAG TPA: endosialidase chaperone [Caudoviricetes sp.]